MFAKFWFDVSLLLCRDPKAAIFEEGKYALPLNCVRHSAVLVARDRCNSLGKQKHHKRGYTKEWKGQERSRTETKQGSVVKKG